MKLYHATFKARLASIEQHGLGNSAKLKTNWSSSFDFNKGKPCDCVYLAKSPEEALSFVEVCGEDSVEDLEYYSGFVVLEVDQKVLIASQLTSDPNNKSGETYLYKGCISFKDLKKLF